MNSNIEAAILACEERLQRAMMDSDVAALDELIAPDLMFTNHMGQVVSKEDDLDAHRAGLLKIDGMMPSGRRIVVISENVAVVSVLMRISGSYMETPVGGAFRYTRVWQQSPEGAWKIVAGHSCIVQGG
jgi:ketosteroid isomerase-like protein